MGGNMGHKKLNRLRYTVSLPENWGKLKDTEELTDFFTNTVPAYGAGFTHTKGSSVESVLSIADRLVSTERAAEYGSISENATKTIAAYRAFRGSHEVKTPEDHCLYMLLYKLGRECTRHKRDNLIDAPGYIKLWDELLGGK